MSNSQTGKTSAPFLLNVLRYALVALRESGHHDIFVISPMEPDVMTKMHTLTRTPNQFGVDSFVHTHTLRTVFPFWPTIQITKYLELSICCSLSAPFFAVAVVAHRHCAASAKQGTLPFSLSLSRILLSAEGKLMASSKIQWAYSA